MLQKGRQEPNQERQDARKPLTPEQAKLFNGLHFRVLKTKAEYHPNHLIAQGLLFQGYVRAQKHQGQLEIHTMRGKYGMLAATVQENATPAEIVEAIQATQNGNLQWLLENDEQFRRPQFWGRAATSFRCRPAGTIAWF